MNDARLGIVRLPLPDGREVALQLTFARLDMAGHSWFIERLGVLAKGKAGSATARGELLEAFTDGAVKATDVIAAPVASFPVSPVQAAIFQAWEIAQYGPSRRPASEGAANPQMRRPTPWMRVFGRRSAQA